MSFTAEKTKSYLDDFKDDFEDNYEECSYETYSPEQEQELLLFATSFFGDLKYLAKQYISSFFKDKRLHSGGKIPKILLLSDSHISMVVNYDIIKSVKKAYSCLENHESSVCNLGEVTGDIRLVSGILNSLSASNIPQQFAGGMMLIYLKFVEGVEIGQ